MKEVFRSKKFGEEKRDLLAHCINILKEYESKEIKVTLRQLYYQLVARDIIRNEDREYRRISKLLTDARYCGLVDWSAIEDRIRKPVRHIEFDDIPDAIEYLQAIYRLNRWEDQDYYVELFTEKDALSSVIYPIANKYHIYFNVNRGYSSSTAVYDAGKRFIDEVENGARGVLLYLGDHDPSGLDMIRDMKDRLDEFGLDNTIVKHIALRQEQIKKYNPPPNYAKVTDPRGTGYIKRFGRVSWEVDALPPDVLIDLVENALKELIDIDKMNDIIYEEKKDIEKLGNVKKDFEEGN